VRLLGVVMSAEYRRTRNKHGDPVLVITVTGWHDIFRLNWNLLHAQCEFSASARQTFRWMRRCLGAKRYDAFDQSMTGGKTRAYSIRRKRQL
jgi:hypothetical protein